MGYQFGDGGPLVGLTCVRCSGRIERGDWVAVGYVAGRSRWPGDSWSGALWHMRCVDPKARAMKIDEGEDT